MPKGERKEYTKEFKLAAVYMMKSKTMKPKEVYTTLGVDRQTVYRWVQEFDKDGEAAFTSKVVVPGPELRILQKQKKDLEMENEILKKAIAYFAKLNAKE